MGRLTLFVAVCDAAGLQDDGWRVVTCGWRPYDERMPWGADAEPIAHYEADMADPDAPTALVEQVSAEHGAIRALVICHCESTDSDVFTTTIESSGASSRHSAATNAVLPLPTGPPIPMRSARSRASPGAGWSWSCESSCAWLCE